MRWVSTAAGPPLVRGAAAATPAMPSANAPTSAAVVLIVTEGPRTQDASTGIVTEEALNRRAAKRGLPPSRPAIEGFFDQRAGAEVRPLIASSAVARSAAPPVPRVWRLIAGPVNSFGARPVE